MQLKLMAIAERMKKVENVKTQKALAERAGIARPTVSVIFRTGTCRPDTAMKIADALDCDLKEIAKL